MEQFTIEVQKRSEMGKGANGRLRRQGLLPAVAYSHGMPSQPISLSDREFVRLARLAGASQVFTLKSSEAELNGRPALVKEIQQDFVKGRVLHVDLQLLREDEEVSVRVHLVFSGEPAGVKLDGGIMTAVVHEVGVSCLPKHIPHSITVDVSALRLGQSIHAGDLSLPEGVTLTDSPEETIVSVVAVRATIEEAAAAAAPAEGAAAPAAEGAAAEGGEKKEK